MELLLGVGWIDLWPGLDHLNEADPVGIRSLDIVKEVLKVYV